MYPPAVRSRGPGQPPAGRTVSEEPPVSAPHRGPGIPRELHEVGGRRVDCQRFRSDPPGPDRWLEVSDFVAEEEPLEIRLRHGDLTESLTVTMRSPGHDPDLVAGFLFAEGIIDRPGQIRSLRGPSGPNDQVVDVELEAPFALDPSVRRKFLMSSSCGVCGRSLLRGLGASGPGAHGDPSVVGADWLLALPSRLRDSQPLFETTGGLHAAALFDVAGPLRSSAEDVGRHNAVDKVIGREFRAGAVPSPGTVLQVSGRASYEIVQKAARARIPILSAVSAPSTMAIRAAAGMGITLVGFLRDRRFNVYTAPERITRTG